MLDGHRTGDRPPPGPGRLYRVGDRAERNVFGTVRMTQLVLPGMRRAGWGRIVNVSSMGGRATLPGGGAYHASKYAVEAMSDALRFEVRGFGIRVSLIEPGPVASEFVTEATTSPVAARAVLPTRLWDAFLRTQFPTPLNEPRQRP